MAIETICAGCGKRLAVADEFAGRRARCPACGHTYTVPPAGSSAYPGEPATIQPLQSSEFPAHGSFSKSANPESSNDQQGGNFWMKATNGQEYGPVDRATLDRWFVEGRIGAGYQIRNSEFGDWQPALAFQPSANIAASAANQPFRPATTTSPSYIQWAKPDRSGLILGLGILSWFLCPICGVIAWVMGGQTLRDMQQGLSDPSNRGVVQAGYYLGMVHIICVVCCVGLYVMFIIGIAVTAALNQ